MGNVTCQIKYLYWEYWSRVEVHLFLIISVSVHHILATAYHSESNQNHGRPGSIKTKGKETAMPARQTKREREKERR